MEFHKEKGKYVGDENLNSKRAKEKAKKAEQMRKLQDSSFDDMLGDSKDLFFDDNSDKSIDHLNDSFDSVDNFMTEKAFHNDIESSLSITERSGKFIMLIYVELLRIIKSLEKDVPASSNSKANIELDSERSMQSVAGGDEMNEEALLN